MSNRLLAFEPDDAVANLLDVSKGTANWDRLRRLYSPDTRSAPLDRIIDVLRANGCVSVVVERRYTDPDWQSEHSAFYAKKFGRYPSVCHRLHFFSRKVRRIE